MNKILNSDFFLIAIICVSILTSLLVLTTLYIRRRSKLELKDRYDSDRKMVELEYMRKNMEMQLYDISRKLEESEHRWRDINHLVITSQNKLEAKNYNKGKVAPNDFLDSIGISNARDFEIEPRQVFYLTPFNTDYNETFFSVRSTCEKLRLNCIRGDEEFVPNDVFSVILKQIVKSRFLIANITGRNPNVMYELGVAHALGKPTIIIAKNFTDIPFDLNNKRIIIFDETEDLSLKLENSINDLLVSREI